MNDVEDWPASAMSGDVEIFSAYLRARQADYIARPQQAGMQVRFVGRLLGEAVVWDGYCVTLRAERERLKAAGAAANHLPTRNFIDVAAPAEHGVPLTVCLDVERVDEPAIRKMIVMVRQYRPLRPGRHEFGPVFEG